MALFLKVVCNPRGFKMKVRKAFPMFPTRREWQLCVLATLGLRWPITIILCVCRGGGISAILDLDRIIVLRTSLSRNIQLYSTNLIITATFYVYWIKTGDC